MSARRFGRVLAVFLAAFALCSPVSAQALSEGREYLVGVYYFAGWWRQLPNKWTVDGRDWRAEYPDRVPTLGEYNEQPTMDREIATAAAHGVDFFQILWYPNGGPLNEGLRQFLASTNADRMHFTIEYVNHPPFDLAGDEDWERACQEWCAAMKHPSYLKVDGRPVFKIHGLDYFYEQNDKDPERVQARLARFRQMAQDRGLSRPLISSGVMPEGVPSAARLAPFDFVTTYMDMPALPRTAEPYPYERLLLHAEKGWRRYAEHCAKPYVPYVPAGWDPRPWGDPRPSFAFPTRDEWAGALQSARRALDQHPQLGVPTRDGRQKMVLIYAWNEFGEGGILAPTVGEKESKLQAIQKVFGPPAEPPLPRIVRMNGVPTLEADGRPFLLVGAQCDIWRSTRQDAKTVAFFDAYQAMHATAVSVGIPWSRIELAMGQYDFRFVDWFVEQARTRGLRLVLNLFNSNVCGKVGEGAGTSASPLYTPAYLLEAPEQFQRMILPGPWRYDPGGPPMCPNDPRTLEREKILCVKLAEHLARTDLARTVIMLQIDNEFYYQQWAGARPPNEKAVRCHCRFCDEKWEAGRWRDGEMFMFQSFAEYVRVLTEAIAAVHPIPLYINSPWWPPAVIPVFLDRCPKLALVGIDGVFAPNEPNMLSQSQLGRNIPFAAENPTENPKTRLNLDVLPYYSLVGQQGIGNLLWECGPPHTVLEDPAARERYGAALYPIHRAQTPLAEARGTDRLVGWYTIRDVATEVTTDIFGNFVPARDTGVVAKDRFFVREGNASRTLETNQFTAVLGDLRFTVSEAPAGFLVRRGPDEVVLGLPRGAVAVEGPRPLRATEGHFDGDVWRAERAFPLQATAGAPVIRVSEAKVILLQY